MVELFCDTTWEADLVSILQMYRLNMLNVQIEFKRYKVSILQMYRLNFNKSHILSVSVRVFQYFKCIGWIFLYTIPPTFVGLCFNTSNVSVEFLFKLFIKSFLLLFQYFKCIGWISLYHSSHKSGFLFQYFKCIGWIKKKAGNLK